jgi:hypothetical protein
MSVFVFSELKSGAYSEMKLEVMLLKAQVTTHWGFNMASLMPETSLNTSS